MSCNLLDCMLIFCLLVILDMGFVNERDSDPQASVIVVMIFVVLMALAISGVVLQGSRQYFQQKFKFCFFACHQKTAAGSLARLLKMELEMRLPGTKTFIDCDDLRDLAKLFTLHRTRDGTFFVVGISHSPHTQVVCRRVGHSVSK